MRLVVVIFSVLALVAVVTLGIYYWYSHRNPSSLVPPTTHSCNVVFQDSPTAKWTTDGKEMALKACKTIIMSAGNNALFLEQPLTLNMYAGTGGAATYDDTKINFYLGDVQAGKIMYSTFLHEATHAMDFRRGRYTTGSMSPAWLLATSWKCDSAGKCTHACMQTPQKTFYCSYKNSQVLPSRYGDPSYDPNLADVSINPIEDFAESSRYFFEANDELKLTSPDRCLFMRNYYSQLSIDSCFDCNPETVCKVSAN